MNAIPQIGIPEQNKKPGVCYAASDDGIELPVIDVSHPAFARELGPAELRKALAGAGEMGAGVCSSEGGLRISSS